MSLNEDKKTTIKIRKNLMDIKELTDVECLKLFLDLMETRIGIDTSFIKESEDSDNLTHQIMYVVCGTASTVSNPQPLPHVLRLATAEEQGATLN